MPNFEFKALDEIINLIYKTDTKTSDCNENISIISNFFSYLF